MDLYTFFFTAYGKHLVKKIYAESRIKAEIAFEKWKANNGFQLIKATENGSDMHSLDNILNFLNGFKK